MGCVFSDLAARTCLVNDKKSVSVGDFGLSRALFSAEYVTVSGSSFPLRWMAPELLQDLSATFECTCASDVWAFGVTAWEIGSLGALPYPNQSSSEIVKHVTGQKGLALPSSIARDLGDVCNQSLVHGAAERPTFARLHGLLDGFVTTAEKAYLDPAPAPAVEDVPEATKQTFAEMKARKKSVRGLQAMKDAENPAEALDAVAKDKVKEWDRSQLELTTVSLGQGAFGVVLKGLLTLDDGSKVACACKTLKNVNDAEGFDDLTAEAKLVAGFDNDYVIRCFGQIMIGEPAMILLEFCGNGSLWSYLDDLPKVPELQRMMQMAIDIGKGMAHLAEKNFVHRDLAARNILVGDNLECKISDFGLSREISEDDQYYQSEGGMVPIRWTPPEAYKFKKYSTLSDVWSYGITLYEIWTKSALPYGKKWTNMNVMMEVEKGYRLPPPPNCPSAVYKLMLQCWNPGRRGRPEFSKLVDMLQMAYDMLFPDAVASETVEVDMDYGDMSDMYYGVPVPDEDNLDSIYSAPVPLAGNEAGAVKPDLSKLGSPNVKAWRPEHKAGEFKGSAVAQKPDRFAKITSSTPYKASPKVIKKQVVQERPVTPPAPTELSKSAVRADEAAGLELRKQKVSDNNSAAVASGTVETTKKVSVAEMLKLSQAKEAQSLSEEVGLKNVAGAVKQDFVETVGKAKDTTAMVRKTGAQKGNKCVCRRFKCVCVFD